MLEGHKMKPFKGLIHNLVSTNIADEIEDWFTIKDSMLKKLSKFYFFVILDIWESQAIDNLAR